MSVLLVILLDNLLVKSWDHWLGQVLELSWDLWRVLELEIQLGLCLDQGALLDLELVHPLVIVLVVALELKQIYVHRCDR